VKHLLIAVLFLVAGVANAATVDLQREHQRQHQRQHQWQDQNQVAQGGDARSTAGVTDSGNSSNRNLAQGGSSEGNATNVDAGTQDNSRFSVLPNVIPETPATAMGTGNVMVWFSACGPLQRIYHDDKMTAEDKRFLHKATTVDLGSDDHVGPVLDDSNNQIPFRQVGAQRFGSQVVIFATTIGVSNSSSFALGGGSGAGNWGQLGGGATSGMQRLTLRAEVVDCILPDAR
jgi:hypothetical protein